LLVAAGLGVEPEPQFAAACWEATGGTPFLVRTLVEALQEEGVAPVTSSAAKVQNIATATLGRWAMLRLARLGSDAADLAQAVAILERAELDQAARLAGLAPLNGARAVQLLVRAGVLDEAPLCFAHPILRAAVYREMAVIERAEAHGRAARLLAEAHASAARVAEHLLASAPAGDAWVVEQLRAAAWEATARGAPESAGAYLRRALTEPPPPEVRADLLLELGVAEFNAGQPGWHDHLEEAVEAAADDTTRTAAALVFANALRFHHGLAEAVEVCDGVAARLDSRDAEAHLTLEAMAVLCGLLDDSTAPSVVDRARALLFEATERAVPRQALAVAAFAAALANQPADQVADLARRAIAAGSRALPEPGDPPWFQSAVIAFDRSICIAHEQILVAFGVKLSGCGLPILARFQRLHLGTFSPRPLFVPSSLKQQGKLMMSFRIPWINSRGCLQFQDCFSHTGSLRKHDTEVVVNLGVLWIQTLGSLERIDGIIHTSKTFVSQAQRMKTQGIAWLVFRVFLKSKH